MKKRHALTQTHSLETIAYTTSLFFAVRRIMRTALAKDKTVDPSTWLRIETMKFIAEHEKSKMKDLADYLFITAPSATSLVGGLVKNGLVTGHTSTRDRRAAQLVLTRKGKIELKKAIGRGIKAFRGVFSILSKDELASFTGALERIKENSTAE